MDVFDQATELERLDREAALSRARAAMDQGGPDWIDGVACCRECGEPIPQKRLEALPGVTGAVVSHETGTAVVRLSADVPTETLAAAVTAQGYKVV